MSSVLSVCAWVWVWVCVPSRLSDALLLYEKCDCFTLGAQACLKLAKYLVTARETVDGDDKAKARQLELAKSTLGKLPIFANQLTDAGVFVRHMALSRARARSSLAVAVAVAVAVCARARVRAETLTLTVLSPQISVNAEAAELFASMGLQRKSALCLLQVRHGLMSCAES